MWMSLEDTETLPSSHAAVHVLLPAHRSLPVAQKKYQSSPSVMPVLLSPSSSRSLSSHPPPLHRGRQLLASPTAGEAARLCSLSFFPPSLSGLLLSLRPSFAPFSLPLFLFLPAIHLSPFTPATPSPSILFLSSSVLSSVSLLLLIYCLSLNPFIFPWHLHSPPESPSSFCLSLSQPARQCL